MMDDATDDEVRAVEELLENPFSNLYQSTPVRKLLARLRRVEGELTDVKQV